MKDEWWCFSKKNSNSFPHSYFPGTNIPMCRETKRLPSYSSFSSIITVRVKIIVACISRMTIIFILATLLMLMVVLMGILLLLLLLLMSSHLIVLELFERLSTIAVGLAESLFREIGSEGIGGSKSKTTALTSSVSYVVTL